MLDLNDVVKVVFTWYTSQSTIAQIVRPYLITAGTGGDPDDLLGAMKTKWETAWAHIDAFVADEMQGGEWEMFQWDFALDQWDSVATLASTAMDGVGSAQMHAHGVGYLVRWATTPARYQGRNTIPGVMHGYMIDGLWNTTITNAMTLWGTTMDDKVTYVTIDAEPGTFNESTELFHVFNGTTFLNTIPAYQRRRKPGVGV